MVFDEIDVLDVVCEVVWFGWFMGGLWWLGSWWFVIVLVVLWVGVLFGVFGYGFVVWLGWLLW